MKNTKKKKKQQQDKTLPILGGVFAVVLIVMIVVLCIPKTAPKGEFTPPAFEPAAVQGKPEVDESLGYTELYQDGMAYRVSVCGVPQINGNELTVYFTNTEGNEKYLKLRVLDEKGNTLGETGLLKPGEYVKTVTLSKKLSAGTNVKLKVMSYETEDYTSGGSVVLNMTVAGTNSYLWLWITLVVVAVAAAVLIVVKKKKSNANANKKIQHGKNR